MRNLSKNGLDHRQRHSAPEKVFAVLDSFRIEVPSWGFANTGTRFGKFIQPAATTTIEEKFADAAEVNRLTGEGGGGNTSSKLQMSDPLDGNKLAGYYARRTWTDVPIEPKVCAEAILF